MVEDGTDCDDTNPGAFPGATEVWYDGIDSDCAGDADNDRDGDGFPGGPGGTDCDDEEALAYPLAEEVCGDGIDNNCDGYLGDCGLTGSVDITRATTRLLGHTYDVAAGTSVALLGSGDAGGTPTAVIGAPRLDSDENPNVGGAFLADATETGVIDLSTGIIITGDRAGGQSGSQVQRIHDVNSDGAPDFLILDATGPGPSSEMEVVIEPDTGLIPSMTDTGIGDTGSSDTGSVVVPPTPPRMRRRSIIIPGEPNAGCSPPVFGASHLKYIARSVRWSLSWR